MNSLQFTDNPLACKMPDTYIEIQVDTAKVLESWQMSLLSFEWLAKNGRIKPTKDLKEPDRAKRTSIETAIKNGQPITKSVLGIGLYENIEIGSGKAEFLTLAASGFQALPVHIHKSHEQDFKPFLADVK